MAKCSIFGGYYANYMIMVGRTYERKILRDLLETPESEFLTVVGRRRVGKTYMIRQVYEQEIIFEFVGIQYATLNEQLSNFQFALKLSFPDNYESSQSFENWLEAFQVLIQLIEKESRTFKPVIFIDELPWVATAKSGFLKALGFFWNSWASKNNIVLATCGSAASWMIKALIQNQGGLHNRVTKQIFLKAFSLAETEAYLQSRNVMLNQYQISQLYMSIGGIPFYLKQVSKGKSVAQIVESLFFTERASLKNEFDNLYRSLFKNHEKYVSIIKACYSKWEGITHVELAEASGFSTGGSLTRMIRDLEVSGFLQVSDPYNNKKKNSQIRLIDEFSIFYLKFIHGNKTLQWQAITTTQAFKAWQGFSFENLCLKHIQQIKNKLGIRAVITKEHSYSKKGTEDKKGTQIDLIIDRNDQIVNLCEIKFYNKPFSINKNYKENLLHKYDSLQQVVDASKSIHLTLISSYGLKKNKYSSMIQEEVTLNDLFKD